MTDQPADVTRGAEFAGSADPRPIDPDRPTDPDRPAVADQPAATATTSPSAEPSAGPGVDRVPDPDRQGPPSDPGPSGAEAGEGSARLDWRAWRTLLVPSGLRPRGGVLAIVALLALLGFSLVVQVKSVSTDESLGATRQEDLVRILSDLESQEERLRQEIAALEESQRQLSSGAQGREAALEEATRQADELGILAGTLRATGPGLAVRFSSGAKPLRAFPILDAVQELRGAGAEAMQISGGAGGAVRIVASTAFLDADGGIAVGGRRLTGPYTITVIGDPSTMRTALNIPGGVVASVRGDGGNVTIEERAVVDVSALAAPVDLRHARPVS